MRRFQFDHDDEDEDEEEEFRDPEFMQSPFLAPFPFDMGSDPLLDSCIKICENSIFWKFYSIKTKLSKIKEVHNFLISLEEKTTEDTNKDKNA